MSTPSARFPVIVAEVKAVLKNLSGRDLSVADSAATFFDLGFDSLLLTQASQSLRQKFGVKLTFRQLLEDLVTIDAVSGYLDEKVPADKFTAAPAPVAKPAPAPAAPAAPVAAAPKPAPAPAPRPATPPPPVAPIVPAPALVPEVTPRFEIAAGGSFVDRVLKQQLQVMSRQLDLLRGGVSAAPQLNGHAETNGVETNGTNGAGAHVVESNGTHGPEPSPESSPFSAAPEPASASTSAAAPEPPARPATAEVSVTPKYFGPFKPIDKSPGGGLTERQQKHLEKLIADTIAKFPRSKAYTAKHRTQFADPRTISGFRQHWKEMVFPIVVKHSEGSRLIDLDGHKWVDFVMGFGTNLWGHSPEFLTRAHRNQLNHGVEVGPQSPIAGKVAQLMCELTGHERAAFCSTGSEAVLAAIRLARTFSGRTKIATTSGYHGINDEVLVRAGLIDGQRVPQPVAPGIPQHAVSEVLVLDYGTQESLDLLREHAHELACILIEPVQSRKPDLVPVDFLREVRKITEENGVALVFDEMITGFRTHPGGTQALWGIKADMATYGKIIGGGVPCGVLCGKAAYLDALDGGDWKYGDDSGPEVGLTFFAGTYVRHPIAIRGALSVLTRIKREGPALQEKLAARTDALAHELNSFFEQNQVPMRMTWFRSMIYFVFQQEFKYSSLLFFHLRLRGLHIWEGRPVFLSTAHTDEDIAFIVRTFKESLAALREGGFLPEPEAAPAATAASVALAAPKVAAPEDISTKPVQFSLYFFGNYAAEYSAGKYGLLLDATKFADANGFTAIWLPERHFHSVGGFSPNSSVLAGALALETKQIQLRGGSVVLPLHHPVRVAEEWAVVDNLSQGRTGISIASGWHPNDFVFAPENFEKRREINITNLQIIRRLWRGESMELPIPGGGKHTVKLFPQPMQKELPFWFTCIHKESYAEAGRQGANVLGYLMNQTVDELAEKIAAYRAGRRAAGLNPAEGHVTTLLYTYLDETAEKARETARGPLCHYLRSYLDNSQKRIEGEKGDKVEVDQEDIDYLTNRSCDDYFNGKSLIGTAESVLPVVAKLKSIGVDEIGCFVDFGVEPAQALSSLAEVAKLQATISAAGAAPAAPVEDITVPLPEAEKGIWMLGELNADANRAYTESNTLTFKGTLDAQALADALRDIVVRHGALRTTINPNGESQVIRAAWEPEVAFYDYSALPAEARAAAAEQKMVELENELFPGLTGPFLRASLFKLEPDQHVLLLNFHHALGNGPSYWVFLDELAALYGEKAHGIPANLPPAAPFTDFIAKKLAYNDSEDGQAAEQFWIKQYENGVPELELPLDHPRPAELTYLGARQEIILPAELNAALRKVGAAHKASLFMVLYSGYAALLHRLSGQDDLVIGVPFDSPIRVEEEGRNLFANTTNMMPLRSILYDGSSFLDFLQQTKSLVVEASEHQDYFFGRLMRKLNLARDASRSLFFNVTFNLESGEFRRSWPGLELSLETDHVPYRSPRGTAMFDLYLNAAERKNGEIIVQCDHNLAMVEPATMERWLRHYRTLLSGIVANPEQPIATLPLMTKEELQELVVTGPSHPTS
ncbi:MAG: MupA/Atu3671 family FMN-dependent luciferase-like monooxygenase [Verrucomicrobiota bacterium]